MTTSEGIASRAGVRPALVGLVAAVCIALPSSSEAATVFGADLSNMPTQSSFIYSFAPVMDPGGGANTGAPVSGVLVSVRIKTTGAAGTGTIRVLRQTSHPTSFTYGFLNTAPEIPIPFPAVADPAGAITQVLTRRPITAGDKLGWFFNDPSTTVKENYNDPTAECAFTGTPHGAGTTVDYSTGSCNNNIVLESGTIEPDADGDGYGDETQDQCPTNASTQGPCPPSPAGPAATQTAAPTKKCKKHPRNASAAKKKCRKHK